MSQEPRDPAELDPETFVASRVVLAQPPMAMPPELPGMTPAAMNTLRIRNPSRRLLQIAREVGARHVVNGKICPNCRCGLKESK